MTEEEEVLSVEVNSDTFSVEYEVESDNTDRVEDSDSSDNISGQVQNIYRSLYIDRIMVE